jgi:hypothetical protein
MGEREPVLPFNCRLRLRVDLSSLHSQLSERPILNHPGPADRLPETLELFTTERFGSPRSRRSKIFILASKFRVGFNPRFDRDHAHTLVAVLKK